MKLTLLRNGVDMLTVETDLLPQPSEYILIKGAYYRVDSFPMWNIGHDNEMTCSLNLEKIGDN